MTAKSENKLEIGERPPVEAGGMVDEETLMARIKEVKESEGKPKISMERVILFMAEKMHNMDASLTELLEIFKGVKPTSKPIVVKQEVKEDVLSSVPKAPATPTETVTTKPVSSRVNEIIAAFKPVSDFVIVDIESSTQYVLVRPKGYLGTEKFADVGKIARGFNAIYVKQGKESHFKIPKMVGEQKTQKAVEAPQIKSSGTVKDLFPENLANLLSFTDQGNVVIIKPIRFLGAENFAKVASIVRNNSGEYISAGKESHFKLPKK